MAENKRSPFEIERDRHEISELYLRKIPQFRIAETLYERRVTEYELWKREGAPTHPELTAPSKPYKLSRQMIGYDLKAVQKSWQQNTTLKLDEYKQQQLASIDALERAAWEGYERSGKVRDVLESSSEDIEFNAELLKKGDSLARYKLPATRKRQRKHREQLLGDPRFLQVIDKCLERREKLLGLAAASELNLNLPEGAQIKLIAGFDPKQWGEMPDASSAPLPPEVSPGNTI